MTHDVSAAIDLARTAFGIPVGTGGLLVGGASANRLVRLSNSVGSLKWVLRCPLRDPRPDRLHFVLDVHRAARSRGLPIAVARHTVDGQPWAVDSAGRPWVLFNYLPGRPLMPVTAWLAEQAGAQLATLHRLPRNLGVEAPEVGSDSPWYAWMSHPDATWKAVDDVLGEDRRLLTPYRSYVTLLERYGEPLHGLDDTVWGHGDYHGHNLLHQHGRITGIIDLDGVGQRPRVLDIATAVLMLARTASGDYRIQPHLANGVLSGYQQAPTPPLTDLERAALWPAMVLSQLPDPNHLAALRAANQPITPALTRPLAALTALHLQRAYLTRLLATGGNR